MTRPSTPLPHFPCHHVTWPSCPVIAMSLPTCLLRHAMSLPTCLLSHPAMSLKCQLCKLLHTCTLDVWCILIHPRGPHSSPFVVISNFQRWCGGHVVYVGVLSSLNLDDKWLISYSLATTNRSQVQTEGHVPNKRLILQFFIQSLWYAMCPRVGGIRLNLD
jgi:hypothetical protein